MLSGDSPLILTFSGVLGAREVDRVALQIAPEAAGIDRNEMVLGFRVSAADGNHIDPGVVKVTRADGAAVDVCFQSADTLNSTTSIVVAKLRAGAHTVEIAGVTKTASVWKMEVFLIGDLDGDGHVMPAELNQIAAAAANRRQAGSYLAAADADCDGQVTLMDLRFARGNCVGTGYLASLQGPSLPASSPFAVLSKSVTRQPVGGESTTAALPVAPVSGVDLQDPLAVLRERARVAAALAAKHGNDRRLHL